jgi:hypothetical protein
MVGNLSACRARAATGHTAAPPSSVMKSRRFTPDHAQVAELAAARTDAPYVYRRMGSSHLADVLDGRTRSIHHDAPDALALLRQQVRR